jgi:hypothetical protein
MRETSGGCRRDVPLECGNGTTTDGFRVLRGVKLPDTENATVDMSATVEQCRARCLANCSCVAYAPADIRGSGSGCVMWKDGIVDVRDLEDGQELYVRLAKSELGKHTAKEKRRAMERKRIVLPVTLLAPSACMYLVWICSLRG